MKKIIYLTFCALLLISFWSFADAEKKITAEDIKGSDGGLCTPKDAFGISDGAKAGETSNCDKVCDVIDFNKDSGDPEEISADYCGTCPGLVNKSGTVTITFRQLFGGCCMGGNVKICPQFSAKYCEYNTNPYFGKCSGIVKTKSVSNSVGQCMNWYLPPTYSIKNLPMMEETKTDSSRYGYPEVFGI